MFKKHAAALLVGALVLGVGAYAWAQGAPQRPTSGDQTAAAQPNASGRPGRGGRGGHRFGPLQRAIHGDVIALLDKVREVGIQKVGYQIRAAPPTKP